MFGLSRKKISYGIQMVDRQVKIIGASGSSNSRVVKHHQLALSDGVIKEGKIVDELSLIQKLSREIEKLSMKGEPVTVVIPTSSIVLRKAMLPNVKDKELRNLIDVELHSGDAKLPFKNPIFDFLSIREADGQKEVLIFASPMEVVEQYVHIVREAGLEPVAVDTAPLALFRLMVRCYKAVGQRMPQRFMLLDAESDRAEISIFVDGYPVFFRTISIPSHQLIEEDGDQLEAYSRHMSIEMGRVMNYFKYTVSSEQDEVDELILVGDPTLTEELAKALESDFSKITSLSMDRAVSNFDPIFKSFAVPIGLAMKGA